MPIDTAELMKKVRGIRILTSRLVDDRLAGDYHSAFKGQGLEFDEIRAYVPGDDVRSIDWNVTARTGFPQVKRFAEERQLTVIFAVDVSGSQSFGAGGRRTKAELSAEIACLLALTSIRNQDNVGLLLFSDRVVKWVPPRRGRTAVLRIVREVLAADDARGGTDLAAALAMGRIGVRGADGASARDVEPDFSLPFKEGKALLLDEYERRYFADLLRRNGGNVSASAREAGIERAYLQRLIKRFGLRDGPSG